MNRVFDVITAIILLLIFLPLMILISIIIKLESPGPIIFVSKRVGTRGKIFNFYKFRSMRNGAEKELKNFLHYNLYSGNRNNSIFVKIIGDPRITQSGKFIRGTSLDELPQLINVLLGDMSLVGNRPLPLYEAENLMKDQNVKRFLAPAGITGLWQVSKGGKENISQEERISMDNEYALNKSWHLDIKIILLTIPALIQGYENNLDKYLIYLKKNKNF